MNGIRAIIKIKIKIKIPSPENVIGRHFSSFTRHHQVERHYLLLDGFIMYIIFYK